MNTSQLTLFELAAEDAEIRFSPHCWKTRMALAHKGLHSINVPWHFHEKERLTPFKATTVPVLIDGQEVVSDSWAIALYLEDKYPSLPSLFGGENTVPVAAFVNAWADYTLLPALSHVILLDIYQQLHPKDKYYFRQSREKKFGMSLEEVVFDKKRYLLQVEKILNPLRQVLKQKDFISGAKPAYADYSVFSLFMWVRCCSQQELLVEGDPVYKWRSRLLDAYDGLARHAKTPY